MPLAVALEHQAELSTAAGTAELRQTAVGVRAVANHAFLTATATAGISERLSAWADVSLVVVPTADSWGEPEREGD